MDFQKAERQVDPTVYILTENFGYEGGEILAVFATKEAAEIAKSHYETRISKLRGYWYDIETKEVLDKASISESKLETGGAA